MERREISQKASRVERGTSKQIQPVSPAISRGKLEIVIGRPEIEFEVGSLIVGHVRVEVKKAPRREIK